MNTQDYFKNCILTLQQEINRHVRDINELDVNIIQSQNRKQEINKILKEKQNIIKDLQYELLIADMMVNDLPRIHVDEKTKKVNIKKKKV